MNFATFSIENRKSIERKRIFLEEAKMSTGKEHKHVPWYLWPFWAIWQLIAWIVLLTGRVLAVILGLVLMIIGIVLSLTIVGLIVGAPLIVVGLLLVFRGIF